VHKRQPLLEATRLWRIELDLKQLSNSALFYTSYGFSTQINAEHVAILKGEVLKRYGRPADFKANILFL
jgi:hypothetical protein